MSNRKPIECPTCAGALHREGSGARCGECGSQFVLVETGGPTRLAPAHEGQARTALRRAKQRLATLIDRLAKLSASPGQPAYAPDLTPPRSYLPRTIAILVPCFILIWVFGNLLAAVLVCLLPLLVAGVAHARAMKRFRKEVEEYRRRQGEVSDALQKRHAIEIGRLQQERDACGDLVHRIAERTATEKE